MALRERPLSADYVLDHSRRSVEGITLSEGAASLDLRLSDGDGGLCRAHAH